MSQIHFSKLILVPLALVIWAGTATAQLVPGATTETFSYTKGGSSNNISASPTVSDATSGTTYTAGVAFDTPSGSNVWLTAAPATGTVPDTVVLAGVSSVMNGMAAGTYVGTVTLTGNDSTTATITVTLTISSPLSGTGPGSLALAFVKGGGSSQASATTFVTVSNVDASYDTYTTVASSCPTWLDITSSNTKEAKASATDTLTFTIDATAAGSTSPTTVTTCSVALEFNGVAFKTVAFTSLAIVAAQPLTVTSPTASLVYNKGTSSGTTSTAVTVKVGATGLNGTIFSLDVATLPPWLTVSSGLTSNSAATNASTGDTVTFGLSTAVAAALATGNYSAPVGFFVSGYADLTVTINLQISNATPTLSVVPASSPTNVSVTTSMATPAPTAELFSSDEPVPFTATCTVAHSAATYTPGNGFATPCLLNGGTNVVNGTTFTWGYLMTAALDPVLFQATIGNTVTVTITFTGVSSPPAPVVYVYTLQPGVPTISVLGPTSVSAGFSHSDSAVVLVKGTNFIGPGSIVGTAVVPTQVWLGTPATLLTSGNTGTVGSYVVISASEILVTIPGGTLPTVTAGHTGTFVIGVANQTGPAAPTAAMATATLNTTYAPVIYAITSTASYVQPAVGSNPSFAPYELISIFGDNFGLTGSATATGQLDAFGKYITPMVLTPKNGSTAATTLTVTFTTGTTTKTVLTAPVLFSNQNQINLIVPSAVDVGDNYTVTITAAGLTSDGLFTVGTVAADPAIFTLASDGTGQGAIINQNGTVNGSGHAAAAGTTVSIYLAGLGVPDSTGVDAAGTVASNFPNTCVAISDTTSGSPGLIQVVNLKVTTPAYTPPSPAWTSIDGAVMNYGAHDIILGTGSDLNYPPCMATATITATFGPSTNLVTGTVTYAGFVSGSVAGLYQINVLLPSSLVGVGTGSGTLAGTGAQPVTITITPVSPATTFTSQSGVTMIF